MEDEKDREADILLLQQALSALFPEADVFANGKFARFTERIVARFQESKGIKADGVVDQATWSALRGNLHLIRINTSAKRQKT
jgi:peptidoglycan hydrolase-like protein with peptidoglycan-binding domain